MESGRWRQPERRRRLQDLGSWQSYPAALGLQTGCAVKRWWSTLDSTPFYGCLNNVDCKIKNQNSGRPGPLA